MFPRLSAKVVAFVMASNAFGLAAAGAILACPLVLAVAAHAFFNLAGMAQTALFVAYFL